MLWWETLRICRRNGFYPDTDPPKQPAAPRTQGRGRPRDPAISARRYRASRAIHQEIIRRLPLPLPAEPPHDKTLTSLLDNLARQIDEARQHGRKIITEAVISATPYHEDPARVAATYRQWRRLFLVQDLAAFIFAGFLDRGGIVALRPGRPLILPPFTLAHAKPAPPRR